MQNLERFLHSWQYPNNNCIYLVLLMPMLFTLSSLCVVPNCQSCACPLCIFTCATCSPTFYLAGPLLCNPCSVIPSCSLCTSSTVCTSCIDTTYAINSVPQCQLCSAVIYGCANCLSTTNCIACANNYVFNSSNKCQLCSQLMDKCATCSSMVLCTSCVSQTYTINSTSLCQLCFQLIDNCSNCQSPTKCLVCSPNNFVVDPSTFQCVACDIFLVNCSFCNSTTICVGCYPNLTDITVDPISHTCKLCSILISHCSICYSSTHCAICISLYVAIPQGNCVLCAQLMFGCLNCTNINTCNVCSFGLIVQGGCSKQTGCSQVTQVASPKSARCIRCKSSQFYAVTYNETCKCLRGHIAGAYCTTILGCTNVIKNSSGEICLTCNLMQNFILSSPICVCQDGYYLNGLTCLQICGDALLFILQCDDGNNIDGDGCSSTCVIEQNYKCEGSKTISSHCIFVGFVLLKVTTIDKVVDENQIMITITTSPTINNLQLMDITGRYNFDSSGDCSLVSATVIGPSIQLLVQYNSDLIGSIANFSLNFDKNTIQSLPIVQIFPIEDSDGNGFTFDPETYITKLIRLVILILSISTLLIFLLGSYSHKMIGVQTIHALQIIFILQSFSVRYNPLVSAFHYLSLTLGVSNFMMPSNNYIAQNYFKRLTFMQEIIYNIILLAIIQVSVVSLYIFVCIAHNKIKHQTYKVNTWKHKYKVCILKLRVIYYDFLLFPIFIGFFYLICLSLGVFCRTDLIKKYRPIWIESIAVLFMFVFTSFMFFNEWKFFFFQSEEKLKGKKKCKQCYIPIYLTYVILLSFVFQLELFKMISLPIYVCGGIIVCYTIIFIFYRPYKSWVHNVGIIINQMGIMICIAWLVLQKVMPIIKSYESIIAYCQIGWLGLILIWCILRIIYEFRLKILQSYEREQKKSKKTLLKTTQDQQQFSNYMQQAILEQQKKGINSYRLMAQKMRIQEATNNDINTYRRQMDVQQFNFTKEHNLIAQILSKPLGNRKTINIQQQNSKFKDPNIFQLQAIINKGNQKKYLLIDSRQ